MTAFRHRLLQRRFAWLLWLAFLLPLAQGAAAWHALSHARAELAGQPDAQALHAFQCDLCLAAAAVAGGALPGVPPSVPVPLAHDALPEAAAVAAWVAAPARAYRSRAPPLASR